MIEYNLGIFVFYISPFSFYYWKYAALIIILYCNLIWSLTLDSKHFLKSLNLLDNVSYCIHIYIFYEDSI